MFYIVNCSGRHVSLSSLGIMLAPKQGIDLDQKFSRMQTEKSSDLKNAISKGVIKLVRKDGGIKTNPEVKKDSMDMAVLLQIKKMLEDSKSKDIDALADAVASRIGTSKISADIVNAKDSYSSALEENIDPAMLDIIHQKAVDRMTKNVEGQTPSEQTSKIDVDINNRLDELEGLL